MLDDVAQRYHIEWAITIGVSEVAPPSLQSSALTMVDGAIRHVDALCVVAHPIRNAQKVARATSAVEQPSGGRPARNQDVARDRGGLNLEAEVAGAAKIFRRSAAGGWRCFQPAVTTSAAPGDDPGSDFVG